MYDTSIAEARRMWDSVERLRARQHEWIRQHLDYFLRLSETGKPLTLVDVEFVKVASRMALAEVGRSAMIAGNHGLPIADSRTGKCPTCGRQTAATDA